MNNSKDNFQKNDYRKSLNENIFKYNIGFNKENKNLNLNFNNFNKKYKQEYDFTEYKFFNQYRNNECVNIFDQSFLKGGIDTRNLNVTCNY